MKERYTLFRLDWLTIVIYITLVALGWFSIYAAVYDGISNPPIWELSLNSGKQLVFIIICGIIIVGIIVLDASFYEIFAYIIFAIALFLLLLTLLFGKEVSGNKSWLDIGPLLIQPSEFAKLATALAVSKFIGAVGFKMNNWRNQLILLTIIGLPMVMVLLQGDAGTALVFTVFALVLFMEGMSPFLILISLLATIIFILTLSVQNQIYLHAGVMIITMLLIIFGQKKAKRIVILVVSAIMVIAIIESVDYVIADVLKPHQENRIKALINPNADPLGYGWNVTQSKIAIGSGGLLGKGFLNGTQTKFDFVPEQSTDFIFCTIGEEHGWVGSLVVLMLFVTLLLRIMFLANRQKSRFARSYGYSVACILFFHFTVNIGMTIGLFPVIGIPLPFLSYGGSSLGAFTILLFILLKLDTHRGNILKRI